MANEPVRTSNGTAETPLPKALANSVEIKPAEIEARGRVRRLRPGKADYESAFGSRAVYSRGKDKRGREQYGVRISGQKQLAEALDMQAKALKADQEWHQGFMGRQERVMIRDRNGFSVSALASSAEYIAKRRGMHERPYYGRPSARYKVVDGELVRIV